MGDAGGKSEEEGEGGWVFVLEALRDSAASNGGSSGDYSFFTKNTFSKECALLGMNFFARLKTLLPMDAPGPDAPLVCGDAGGDPRVAVISVLYLFYKYQLHQGDMALNLATCLVYLEEADKTKLNVILSENSYAIFNLILYSSYLAHAWNDDVTIRLKDWYNDVGRIYFRSIREMNFFIWNLWANVLNFRLNAPSSKVRKVIRTLCALPQTGAASAPPTVRFNPEY